MVPFMIKRTMKRAYNLFFDTFLSQNYKKKLENLKERTRVKETEECIYYVISCENMPQEGMFGYMGLILAMICYAVEKGMVPVIDMKNYPNTYLEDCEVGKINSWELFFRQISEFSIDDVYASKKYVIGNHMDIDWGNLPNIGGYCNHKKYALWHFMYHEYAVLSQEAADYCNQEEVNLLKGRESQTLGVLVRGTDIKKAKGHAVQPPLEEVIQKCKEVIQKDSRFQYIYLATEERKNEELFRKAFPDRVIVNKRTYYDEIDYSKGLSYVRTNREHDRYTRGMEYLSSIRLLSKCGGLVAGQCGGAFAAFYWNEGSYRTCYFWELGSVI